MHSVILGNVFNIPGFPVDTHVKRLLNRIGMVKSDSPEAIERAVCAQVSPDLWCNFSHLLIMFVLRFIPYYEKYVIYPVNAVVAGAASLAVCVLMKKAFQKHSWFMGL